jgi:hypothetical protein
MATANQPTNNPITVPTHGPDNRPAAQTNTMRSFTKPGRETAISSINPNTAKIHNAVPRSPRIETNAYASGDPVQGSA